MSSILPNPRVRYGLIGLGPVGCILAAYLVKAGQKLAIYCIEPKKAQALREYPLIIRGALEVSVQATDIYEDLPGFVLAKPQVVFIATKSCHSSDLLGALSQQSIARDTIFVACQNGLDVERYIIERFGTSRALRMVLHMGCHMENDHKVHVDFCRRHVLSLRPEVDAGLTRLIAGHLCQGGFFTDAREDYRVEVFKKAILNTSLGTVCALADSTMKQAIEDPELVTVVRRMVLEAIDITRSENLPVSDSFCDEAMTYFAGGGNHKPSMLMDVERGLATENEDHCGRFHYYAVKNGVLDPTIHTAYSLMKTLEKKSMRPRRE